jgi:methylmalonyl-CoA/ethylmalonyl-CoA epimerase
MQLNHTGFVVGNIEAGIEDFSKRLQATWDGKVTHDPYQRVNVCFLTVGNAVIELVQPATEESPVSRFLSRGGGLHHLCYEVDDLDVQLELMSLRGVIIASPPRPAIAFANRRIAWVMTGQRMLIELLETSSR